MVDCQRNINGMHLILWISIFNLSPCFSFEVGFSEYSEYTDAYSRSDIEMMKNSKNKNLYKQSEPEQGTMLNIGATETKPKQENKKPTNWYLLYLSGNTSVVHKRLPDFLNYLKINLGGLTESDYEKVSINSVSYVPSLIVNISFTGNYTVKQLVKLSERNDSILVLSSIPFYLTTVTSHNDILIPKPFTNSLSTAREEEALIYLAIGAAIAFVLSAGVLVSILILVKKKDRIKDKEPLIRSQSRSLSSRYQDPPQMIYSETFSQGLEREKERLHQFTPIDDNFAPVETEVDFVPRYIKDDERASWMSEGSILDTTTSSNYNHKKNLSTFSDECSEANPDHDRRSQMSRSPFYWTLESQSHSPTPTVMTVNGTSPSPQPINVPTSRKKPPRPPSRTDSLNPRSTTKTRPKSSITSQSSKSDIPTRRLSVPAPFHMSSRPGSVVSNFSNSSFPTAHAQSPTFPFPPAPAISQEQIDKDVHSILRNLDIVEEVPQND